MSKKVSMSANCNDTAMIRDSDLWPMWPCLPLKRRNNSLEDKNLGFLLATEEHRMAVEGRGKLCVYHGYIFSLPKTQEQWDAIPRTEYATVEELLADDWIVD